jgi:hypothetical protein
MGQETISITNSQQIESLQPEVKQSLVQRAHFFNQFEFHRIVYERLISTLTVFALS